MFRRFMLCNGTGPLFCFVPKTVWIPFPFCRLKYVRRVQFESGGVMILFYFVVCTAPCFSKFRLHILKQQKVFTWDFIRLFFLTISSDIFCSVLFLQGRLSALVVAFVMSYSKLSYGKFIIFYTWHMKELERQKSLLCHNHFTQWSCL